MATKLKTSSEPKQPAHEIRLGRIKAAIWERETQYGRRYNVTMVRSYQDENGQWAHSQSYGQDDLLRLAKLLDLAHTWIVEQSRAPAEASADQDSEEETNF